MNLHDGFDAPVPTIVLAEEEFGGPGGKTAHGVLLHSEVFDARAVVEYLAAQQHAARGLPARSTVHLRRGNENRPRRDKSVVEVHIDATELPIQIPQTLHEGRRAAVEEHID